MDTEIADLIDQSIIGFLSQSLTDDNSVSVKKDHPEIKNHPPCHQRFFLKKTV